MHPDLQSRFDALEERRHHLLAQIDGYSPEQQAFRPAPHAWAIRDVAHHLLLVEQGVLRALSSHQRPDPGRRTVRDRVGALLVRLVFALGIRVKMPIKGLQPQGDPPLDEIRRQWQQARVAMAAFLEQVDSAQLRQSLLRHPVAGPLDLLQGLDFLGQHFDHHLRQIRRIRSAAGFPA